MSISNLIATYGYLALFALVAVESLGVPVPGETALIVAGVVAGTTGHLSAWGVFGVAAAAAITGDNIGYWIGNKGGYRLALSYGHKVRLDQRKLKVARYLFDLHGAKVVFLGRFVSVLRTYAAFLAGVSRMRWPRFLAANASGGILWAGVYTLAAFFAGAALLRLSTIVDIILGVAAAIAIAVALLVVRRQMSKIADRAEDAYPGPLEESERVSR